MRVGTVGIHCDHGQIVSHQIVAAECLQKPLLYRVFIGPAVAGADADLLERSGGNEINGISGSEVRLYLLVTQRSLKERYQIAGTDYVFAQAANQIDRAPIHQ